MAIKRRKYGRYTAYKWAEKIGVTPTTFRARVRKHHGDLIKAINRACNSSRGNKNQAKKINHRGMCKTLSEWAAFYDIPYSQLTRYRRIYGFSEAVRICLEKEAAIKSGNCAQDSTRLYRAYNRYYTIQQWADIIGVNVNVLAREVKVYGIRRALAILNYDLVKAMAAEYGADLGPYKQKNKTAKRRKVFAIPPVLDVASRRGVLRCVEFNKVIDDIELANCMLCDRPCDVGRMVLSAADA